MNTRLKYTPIVTRVTIVFCLAVAFIIKSWTTVTKHDINISQLWPIPGNTNSHYASTTEAPTDPLFFFQNITVVSALPPSDRTNERLVSLLQNLSNILIDEYMEWHNQTLDAIDSGKLNISDVPILVHWSDKGIGDRFRGMMNAYLCAVLSERLFLIKWEEPFPLSKIFHLGIRTNFTYDAEKFGGRDYPIPTKDFKDPYEAFGRILNGSNLYMICNWDLNSLRLFMHNVPFHYPHLKMSKKLEALGEQRQGVRREWMFRLLFKSILNPTTAFVEHVLAYLSRTVRSSDSNRRNINGLKPFIGIHIRLGNDTQELYYYRFRHQLPVATLAECLAKKLIEESKIKALSPAKFFLATDATRLRSELSKALTKLDRSAKIYYGDWGVKHVKHMNVTDSDMNIYFNTFLEIYMLSHSYSLVKSNSAFNDLSVWWGNHTRGVNFGVEQCATLKN